MPYWLSIVVITLTFLGFPLVASAENEPPEIRDCLYLADNAQRSVPTDQIAAKGAAREEKLAVASLGTPSLWWARQQFDPFGGKLVSDWLTNAKVKQIDLTVNWQLWTLLDYLGRYRFINQFGTVAREYGYNLRILNQRQQCLATYKFNSESNPPKWEILLEDAGRDSLLVTPPVD